MVSVPSDFNYTGNGNNVAQTRVTINYYDNSANINEKNVTKINQQIINNSPVSVKDSGNKIENNNNNSEIMFHLLQHNIVHQKLYL